MNGMRVGILLLVGLIVLPLTAAAQSALPQPAHEMSGDEDERQAPAPHLRSWEDAEGYVSETRAERGFREEEAIGDYGQPRWTAHRRFPLTRVYVRPAGMVDFEWWLESKLNLDDTDDVRHRSQYELEFGLGHRLQLDLYLATQQKGHDGAFELYQEKIELRYALADWGEIWGNPTLYAELVRQHEGFPKGELKLLLGGELGPGWHWGVNLVWEREIGGAHEHEYALTAGLARTVSDEVLSLGFEVKLETVDVDDARFAFDAYEVLGGPSMQVRPVPPMHIDLVFPVGFETEGDETVALIEPTVIAGWEF